MTIVLGLVAILLVIFWGNQLLHLMRQPDNAFPGRWDKPLWVGIVVFLPLLGAFLYLLRNPPKESPNRSISPLEREWNKIQAARNASLPDHPE